MKPSGMTTVGLTLFDPEISPLDGLFFIEGLSDYIPFAAIVGSDNDTYRCRMTGGLGKASRLEDKVKIKHPGLYRISKYDEIRQNNYAVGNVKEYAEYLKKAIINFMDCKSALKIDDAFSYYKKASYDGVEGCFFGTTTRQFYFQSVKRIIVGPGYIYSAQKKDFICVLVIPEQLVEYQRLYFLLNGEFDARGMTFWVADDFDIPSTEYKSFRSAYRKMIKPKIIEEGIPIVEKQRMAVEMMPGFSLPGDLNGVKEWKEKIAFETIMAERETITFSF